MSKTVSKGAKSKAALTAEPELDAKTTESMLAMLQRSEDSEPVVESEPAESIEEAPVVESEPIEEAPVVESIEESPEPEKKVESEDGKMFKILLEMIDWIHFHDLNNVNICTNTFSKQACFSCKHFSYCKLKTSLASQLGK